MSDAAAPLTRRPNSATGRLPLIAFLVLALMTVAAVFIVQSMKTGEPYLWKTPAPAPRTFDPSAGSCRTTTLRFQLQRQADDVDVSVVSDATGAVVKRIASAVPMASMVPQNFVWNGRNAAGAVVPAGTYYFSLFLIHQDHTIPLDYQAALVQVTDAAQPAAAAGC